MNLILIVQAIVAALRFPKELAALIRILEKTPEEKRQDISAKIQAQLDSVLSGGRHEWD